MDDLEIIRKCYAVDSFQGYTEEEIHSIERMFGMLPKVLTDYYRRMGRTEAFGRGQDKWILPEDYQRWSWLNRSDYLILLNENQGVCQAGIRCTDLYLPDPPVYSTMDDCNWVLLAPTTSEFLVAALLYEAVFTFAYNPEEFYWLTEEEMAQLESVLTKYPYELQNWMGAINITFYGNAMDHLVVILNCGDNEPQMLYGAASEASYAKLMCIMEGIGEPL